MISIVNEYKEWINKNPNAGYGETPEKFITALIKDNKQFHRLFKESFKKRYYYLVTFTVRPDTKEEEDTIESYIIKQFKRPPLQIVEAHMSKEYTKKGSPHWHVSTVTTTPLKKDRFNYYIKKYGFLDISKTRHKSNEESLNYINKDVSSLQIA